MRILGRRRLTKLDEMKDKTICEYERVFSGLRIAFTDETWIELLPSDDGIFVTRPPSRSEKRENRARRNG